MITNFVKEKIGKARFKLLKDGTYFGSINGLKGVWANALSREACRKELQEVLEEWLVLQLHNRERIPGFTLPRIHTRSHRTSHRYA